MIITGISPTLRQPKTFHSFVYLQGGRSLVPLPQRLLMIGSQKGGTAVAGQIYQIFDPVQSDALFGLGSQLALMCRMAFACGSQLGAGPNLFAMGVVEPTGAQHTQTFTFGGAATVSDNFIARIAGRYFTVGVSAGDAAATVATAFLNAINAALNNLPLTAAVAAAVLTTTAVSKGVGGNDVLFEIINVPTGLTCVTAAGVAGSGVSDETAALASAAGPLYDAIALENHTTTDIALALAHVTTAWLPTEKKWRWIFVGEPGSIGTATTLAAAANNRAIVVMNLNTSPNLPGELAVAGAFALLSRSRPNGNWDGLQLPLYPPYEANAPTNTQVESALAAGVTPLNQVYDPNVAVQTPGVVKIEKLVTTATTVNSEPFEALRDIAVSRTGAFIAQQLDAAYAARFGASANPDGVLLDNTTVAQVRDMVANILYAAQDARIVKNVDTDITKLVVEQDGSALGRLNVDVTYTVVLGLHQVVFVHRVTV